MHLDDKNPNIAEKVGLGLFGIMLWCSTGGLMFLHFISVYVGVTTITLGIVGFFVAPLGLINGLIFILTGDSIQQYF